MFWQTWGQNLNSFFTSCNPFLNNYMASGFFQGMYNSLFCPIDFMAFQQYSPFLAFPTPYAPSILNNNPYNNIFSYTQNNNLLSVFDSVYGTSVGSRLNSTGLTNLVSESNNYYDLFKKNLSKDSDAIEIRTEATRSSKTGNSEGNSSGKSDNTAVRTEATRSSKTKESKETKKSNENTKKEKTNKTKGQKIKAGGKLGKEFLDKVKQVSKNINCDYNDMLAVINSESSFDTTAGYNHKTGKIGTAVGLIQFTKIAIDDLNQKYGLNLTKEKILKISAIEQLDLAEKYWKLTKKYAKMENKRLSSADLYALTFMSGRANREVLCTKGERGQDGRLLGYYEQNKGLDINGDHKITKSELAQRIDAKRVDESSFI